MHTRRVLAASAMVSAIGVAAVLAGGSSDEPTATLGGGLMPTMTGAEVDPGPRLPAEHPGQEPLRDRASSAPAPYFETGAAAKAEARDFAKGLQARVARQGECVRSTLGEVREIEVSRAAEEGRGYASTFDQAPPSLPVYLCPIVLDPLGKAVVMLAAGPSAIDVSLGMAGDAAEGLPGVVFP